jgi:hypothetical protein
MFSKLLPHKKPAKQADPASVDDADTRAIHRQRKHKTRALLIGINYIGTSSQLNGCINDVNHVYRWLTTECGYDASEIRVLTDDEHVPDKYRPTRKNILDSFEWLRAAIPKEGDEQVNLFLHYSGHGSWDRDRDGDEKDGRDESICPLDYQRNGMIKDDELHEVLVNPIAPQSNVKLTCLFDSCHSGTVLDLRYEYEVAVASNNPNRRSFRVYQNKSVKKTNAQIVLFSGSLDKQYSADAWISGKAQGAMTWGFLNVMRKHRKRAVSYKRVMAELQILLKKKGYEQIPHMCGGNFIPLKTRFIP